MIRDMAMHIGSGPDKRILTRQEIAMPRRQPNPPATPAKPAQAKAAKPAKKAKKDDAKAEK